MPEVEISREDTGQAAVFEASPSSVPPQRFAHLLYAAILLAGFVVVAELTLEPAASMLRWLGMLCAVPLLLMWVITLLRAARRSAVRLVVAPEGLTAHGQLIPHNTIRGVALYPPQGKRPLFVARIQTMTPQQHERELALAGGDVDMEEEKPVRGRRPRAGYRLLLLRRNHQPALILVRGLTLSGGETLMAGLAAELRRHSRPG
ncbi:hypothetical protein FHW79_001144 [Azospirillum sp. OGB3]|uniref:hypothetical protein n=1 Tax=Azospirillum sp. OGB3 TaxID=2587012 RepID=UPI0016065AAD|nr:hypothetical protein [Azospirillum sp. OGB3]MBB3263548.1 hypothetical protein [Azospirillum sp. OGB3]